MPPVAQEPENSLVAGSTVSSSSVPVRPDWSATDNSGVVSGYELQQSVNGCASTNVAPSSATTTSTALPPPESAHPLP